MSLTYLDLRVTVFTSMYRPNWPDSSQYHWLPFSDDWNTAPIDAFLRSSLIRTRRGQRVTLHITTSEKWSARSNWAFLE